MLQVIIDDSDNDFMNDIFEEDASETEYNGGHRQKVNFLNGYYFLNEFIGFSPRIDPSLFLLCIAESAFFLHLPPPPNLDGLRLGYILSHFSYEILFDFREIKEFNILNNVSKNSGSPC